MAVTNQELIDQYAELQALPFAQVLMENNPELLHILLLALLINEGRATS